MTGKNKKKDTDEIFSSLYLTEYIGYNQKLKDFDQLNCKKNTNELKPVNSEQRLNTDFIKEFFNLLVLIWQVD